MTHNTVGVMRTKWVADLADRLTHLEQLASKLTRYEDYAGPNEPNLDLANFILDVSSALKCTYLIWLQTPQFLTTVPDAHITKVCERSLMRIYKATTEIETSLDRGNYAGSSIGLLQVHKTLILQELERWSLKNKKELENQSTSCDRMHQNGDGINQHESERQSFY